MVMHGSGLRPSRHIIARLLPARPPLLKDECHGAIHITCRAEVCEPRSRDEPDCCYLITSRESVPGGSSISSLSIWSCEKAQGMASRQIGDKDACGIDERVGEERLLRYLIMGLEDAVRGFIFASRVLAAARHAPADGIATERRIFRRVRDISFALERRAACGTPGPLSRHRRPMIADTLAMCPRYAAIRIIRAEAAESTPVASRRGRIRDPHDPRDDPLAKRRRLVQLLARIDQQLPELTLHIEERWRARRKAGTRFFELQLRLCQRVREVVFVLRCLSEPGSDLTF